MAVFFSRRCCPVQGPPIPRPKEKKRTRENGRKREKEGKRGNGPEQRNRETGGGGHMSGHGKGDAGETVTARDGREKRDNTRNRCEEERGIRKHGFRQEDRSRDGESTLGRKKRAEWRERRTQCHTKRQASANSHTESSCDCECDSFCDL